MLSRLAARATSLTEHYMPAPYLFALLLTFLAAGLAVGVTRTPVEQVVNYWYGGLWEILTFTTQMVLVLMCGHALVDAPVVKRVLEWMSSLPRTERQAGAGVFLVSWAAALFNWGFCLVVAGVLVREVPKRLPKVSRGYLAAAGYTGFGVWASGLSSSIALVSATAGSPMNIIEQYAQRTVPLPEMLLTGFNVVPVLGMAVLMPLLFWSICPAPHAGAPASAGMASPAIPASEDPTAPRTFAERIEQSRLITVSLVGMSLGYLALRLRQGSFSLDLNMMIFLLLTLGWILHGTPIRYMQAFHAGARAAGPLLLAYPLYGGILGLIRDTGLADWFAQLFVSFSTAYTLPFWSYVSSNVITLFVPSGGGHWAVQGPVMVQAALELDASLPKTAMAVAFGEQTGNLVQPFWALPIVSIGGLSIREMMGYCLLALAIAFPLFGLALLVL
jgi:short-chain fatty acids transporter